MTILPITDAIASLVSYNGSVGEYAIFNYGNDKYICLGAFKTPEEGKLTAHDCDVIGKNAANYFLDIDVKVDGTTYTVDSEFVPTHYMKNTDPVTKLLGNIEYWYFQKV